MSQVEQEAQGHSYYLDSVPAHAHGCSCCDCESQSQHNQASEGQGEGELVGLNYSFIGPKWGGSATYGTNGGVVTWSLATTNYGDEIAGVTFDGYMASNSAEADLIRAAFDAWEAVANIDFVEVTDSTNVDIRLGWDAIDGSSSVLATTWMYVPTFEESIIIFDSAENWDTDGAPDPGTISFYAVALHEIGHAIGLDHDDSMNAIMNAYYSSSNPTLSLQADDIAGAVALYGAAEAPVVETGSGGNDSLTGDGNDDIIVGAGGDDTLSGGGGDDELSGGTGSDVLNGGVGNDVLVGGEGGDVLIGGTGFDMAKYSSGVTASLQNPGRNRGEAQGDQYQSVEGLVGSDFRDILQGNRGTNVLEGGGGRDRLLGMNGNDFIDGGDGGDVINGGRGRDNLTGGAGSDKLKGGGQADVLNGGAGNDRLIGGGGSDRFVFEGEFGRDVVRKFVAGPGSEDVLHIVVDGFDSFSDLNGHMRQSGGATIIDLGGGNTIKLAGVDVNDLGASDFMFS